MAKKGIVIEHHLSVECEDVSIIRKNEWINFADRRVFLHKKL